MTRKDKINTARELLCSESTNVFDCLTIKELDKLKQHSFETEAYINNKFTTVHTTTAEDKQAVSELIQKLDRHAAENSLEERIVVHVSKHQKDATI